MQETMSLALDRDGKLVEVQRPVARRPPGTAAADPPPAAGLQLLCEAGEQIFNISNVCRSAPH